MASGNDPASIGPEDDLLSHEVAAMGAAWGRGERVAASEFLARHAGLGDEAAIRLIYEEVCLRREAGLEVDTSEIVGRYPRWGDEIRDLFECDRLLGPSDRPAAWPEVGESLGPFLLLEELGRGASGRTYLATDPGLADRPVVVKVLSDDQEEHLALAQLRHTHIVPLFSEHAFPGRGLRVLCMPYLGGSSLAQILKDVAEVAPARRSGRLLVEILDRKTRDEPPSPPSAGPFRRSLERSSHVEAAAWIVACLADAVDYAHQRGLVHMDIKPSNVLLTGDGQPILLDFHLARPPIAAGERIADRLGGTPGWMSPEQSRALEAVSLGQAVPEAIDGRSDIVALGLLLRAVLAGPDASRFQRGGRADSATIPGVSVGLADIIRKCLADDPRDRYPDAASLAGDLRRQLHDLPLRGVRNRSIAERLGKWRRRHPGALALAVGAASILLAATLATGTAIVFHRQKVERLRAAIEAGRDDRLAGRFGPAMDTLTRGRADAERFPVVVEAREALDRELRLARRGEAVEALHALSDSIRSRYGAELPPPEEAEALTRTCRTLWDRREVLLGDDGQGRDPSVVADLLEITATWIDLIARTPSTGAVLEPNRAALRLLDDVEAAFGPSLALDLRRRRLGGEPEIRPIDRSDRSPRSEWEQYDLGRFELRSGRIEEAAQAFRAALRTRPEDYWSNFFEGVCAYRLGRLEDAIGAFRTCIALAPDEAIGYYNRALASQAIDRFDDAYRDDSRALELDPGLAEARLNRGIVSTKLGRPEDARSDFERALQGEADRLDRSRLHLNLALVLRELGDRSAALDHAEEAVRLGCPEAAPLVIELR